MPEVGGAVVSALELMDIRGKLVGAEHLVELDRTDHWRQLFAELALREEGLVVLRVLLLVEHYDPINSRAICRLDSVMFSPLISFATSRVCSSDSRRRTWVIVRLLC